MSSAVAAVGRGLKRTLWAVVGVAVLVALYYAVGGRLVHRIDADPAFAEDVAVPDGGSTLVATTAALIRREVDRHGWVANDPIIFPSSLLDDMAAYQTGLIGSARAVVDALAIDRPAPAELAAARAALAVPPDRWIFDVTRGFTPQQATESSYRDAAAALDRFNARLAAGADVVANEPAAVAALVAAFADAVDAAATAGLDHVEARGGRWLDTTADDRFQTTRAALYARHLLLGALAADHPDLFASADTALQDALARLERAAALGPWYVTNGPADGQWRPSHVATQAAYALDAGAALRSLAATLTAGDT